MADEAKTGPDSVSSENTAMAEEWSVARALLGGTPAMRTAGETYLPKHAGEESEPYEARKKSTFLYNDFERGVLNASSKPFSKPIVIESESEIVQAIHEDADYTGRGLDVFGRAFFEDSCSMAWSWIMVDYPRMTEDKISLADVQDDRPYFQHLAPEDVLYVREQSINGRPTITHARIRMDVTQPGQWVDTVIPRILVMNYGGAWESWIQVEGEWVKDEDITVTLPDVPLVRMPAYRRIGMGSKKGIFSDLAWKNVEHWQSSSDQRNALKYGRFPMLSVVGVKVNANKDDGLVIGPSRILTAENPQAKFDYVEPHGRALEAGRKDLEEIKQEMRILSLRPSMPKTAYMAATTRVLDEMQVNSAIQQLAIAASDTIEQAMHIAQRWEGQEPDARVSVHRDFGVDIGDTGDVEKLITLWERGALSLETLWSELERREIFSDAFDNEVEIERIEAESMGASSKAGFPSGDDDEGGDDDD